MNALRTTAASLALTALAACAQQPESIAASYVSPTAYAGLSCADLDAELATVDAERQSVAQQQTDAATRDAVVMGVGLVLFWPVLPLLAIPDHDEDLARLKGETAALRDAYAARCTGETA